MLGDVLVIVFDPCVMRCTRQIWLQSSPVPEKYGYEPCIVLFMSHCMCLAMNQSLACVIRRGAQ